MLPSSSSQLGRYGQINHYKKFWLLQTQLEKQDQSSSTTSLSLGVSGTTNIPTVVKENKPLSSSLTVNGDHNIVAGHGSCRADIGTSTTSSSTSTRGGANFPYSSSNEPNTTTMKFYTSSLCHSHIDSGSLRDSSPLSLAVNCENVAHLNFVNPRSWPSAPPLRHPTSVSGAPLRPPTSANFLSSHAGSVVPQQVVAEDQCESSECSTGGEKRAGKYWDITSSSHSCTTSTPLINKQHHNILVGGLHECNPPTTTLTSLHEVPVPSSSLRSGHGSGSVLRTCSLCGTTKTPLWRSGPDGPKSLCNACGIRVKKSKRLQSAMEAAGGVQVGSSSSSPSSSYKRLQLSSTKSAGRGGALKRKYSIQAPENPSDPIYQKRKKMSGYRRNTWSPSSLAELTCPQNGGLFRGAGEGTAKLAAGLVVDSKNSSIGLKSNIFAKDVEEAAVLLMALSCGLVLS